MAGVRVRPSEPLPIAARVDDGELPEWTNGTVSKTVVGHADRGFESHTLRQSHGQRRRSSPHCLVAVQQPGREGSTSCARCDTDVMAVGVVVLLVAVVLVATLGWHLRPSNRMRRMEKWNDRVHRPMSAKHKARLDAEARTPGKLADGWPSGG